MSGSEATSVPVDERTKARLERLRGTIERETGRTVSQRELLARLVERRGIDAVLSFNDDFDGPIPAIWRVDPADRESM